MRPSPARPSVVIVSEASDPHLPSVIAGIRRAGGRSSLLDLADIPERHSLSVGHVAQGGWGAKLVHRDNSSVLPAVISSVWWRRPRAYRVSDDVPESSRATCMAQLHEAMLGVWSTLDVRWVNDPWSDQRAGHKLRQLSVAHKIGFDLPKTIVTTSVDEARGFIAAGTARRTIKKVLAPNGNYCPPTQFMAEENAGNLSALKASPLVLQEYVPGVDVRVTVVNGELFAAEIDARRTSSPCDFRPVFRECRVSPTTIGAPEERMVLGLMERLDLIYAALDFRRTGDGRLVFLEANPAGQWLFIEDRTGQPISEALAICLCAGIDGASVSGQERRQRCSTPGVIA